MMESFLASGAEHDKTARTDRGLQLRDSAIDDASHSRAFLEVMR
jgi:hypothetical protein